jgi:hypothetical protein
MPYPNAGAAVAIDHQVAAPPPPSAANPPKAPRDYRLDFFRGLALVFIYVDHIPNNALSYLTLRSFAISDAAEVFIFISGYTAALVYGRAMLREGGLMASARIGRRVWQLYIAHLFIFLIYNGEVSYTMQHFNNPLFADELQVGAFLDQPGDTLIHVLLLEFQPSLLNILPLYILLLVMFPVMLLALRRSIWLALVPSLLLYGAVQLWGINLPGYPDDATWYFDPFAYQLLFVVAAIFGYAQVTGRPPLPLHSTSTGWRVITGLAVIVALAAFLVQAAATLHSLIPSFPNLVNVPLWADDKTTLPLPRIANMLALAWLVARLVPREARFLTSWGGWLLIICGQSSLYIFCLTILLSVVANIAYTIVGSTLIIQIVVNMIGLVCMLALGLLLAWFNAGGRMPRRPRPASHGEPA